MLKIFKNIQISYLISNKLHKKYIFKNVNVSKSQKQCVKPNKYCNCVILGYCCPINNECMFPPNII